MALIRTLTVGATLCLLVACTITTGDHDKARQEPCEESSECAEENARCVEIQGGKACTGSLSVASAFQTDCTSTTVDVCAGLICVTLKDNAQKKSGLCTATCTADGDCPGGGCLDALGRKICLRTCGTDDDCTNGYVCFLDTPSQRKFCFVKPT